MVVFSAPKSNDSVRSRHFSAVIRYRNPSSKCQTQRDLAQVLPKRYAVYILLRVTDGFCRLLWAMVTWQGQIANSFYDYAEILN